MDDLRDETLLLLEDGHCLRDQALEVCSRVDVHEAQDYRATSLETLRQMVAAGHGVTLLPELAVAAPIGATRGVAGSALRQADALAYDRCYLAQVHHARSGDRGDRSRDPCGAEGGVAAMNRRRGRAPVRPAKRKPRVRVADGSTRLPVHRLHDEDIERLLASGERKPELVELLGEDGYRELSQLARQARAVRRRGGPTVYVLPGLMGSRIGTRGRLLDDVLWLDIVEVAAGHLTRLALPRGAQLRALGMMWLNTLKLKLSLEVAGFDARSHAYDWRLGVESLAAQLNARIAADARREVMLVGHSMGGLVARATLPKGGSRIRRIVQIGAPNAGSFAPVLALRGVYPTVRKLAALDLRHSAEDLARIVFRTLPSLHELLPEPTGLRTGSLRRHSVAVRRVATGHPDADGGARRA